nr:nicalin-1 like [Tanacetum cinerariifolium]
MGGLVDPKGYRMDLPAVPCTKYKLIVSSPAPNKLSSLTITNIQGWFPGSKADGDSNQLPTISIVASYDTFGAAPALSVGSLGSGENGLWLHVSKPPENAYVKQIFERHIYGQQGKNIDILADNSSLSVNPS